VRRLGLGASEYVHAWTPDGQAVVFESNRNGPYNIFKQGLNQRAPEPLVAGKDDMTQGCFSPDGQWLLYVIRKSPEFSLMRMPAAGGGAELILSSPLAMGSTITALASPRTFVCWAKKIIGKWYFIALTPRGSRPAVEFHRASFRRWRGPTGIRRTGVCHPTEQPLRWSILMPVRVGPPSCRSGPLADRELLKEPALCVVRQWSRPDGSE